jgi:pimeloyl-ACP methyl ester carboxylesterase
MTTDYSERHWTSRDGLNLFARDYAGAGGEARLPVICLHGLTRNSKDFEELAPRLARSGRRILVPDVRGRGLSDWDPIPSHYAPKIYARDILGLLDALGVARAVFLGTSMGGIITMAVAAMRSCAIAAAILNDVGPAIAPEGLARILSYAGKSVEIRDWNDAADYVRRTNAAAFPHYGDEDWHGFARRTFRQGSGGPVLDYDPAINIPLQKPPPRLAGPIAGLLFRRLARRRPTLLVRGETSDIISAAIAGRIQRAAPRLRRLDVPGIGHAPTLMEPDAIGAIEDFLAGLP